MPAGRQAKAKVRPKGKAPTALQLDRYRQIRAQDPKALERQQTNLQRRKDLIESRLQNQYKTESDRLTSLLESMPPSLLKEEARMRLGNLRTKIKI